MGTVYGTLTATGGGGPVNSQDKIQFRNRSTSAVTELNVSDTGQYTVALSVGTYDIGVNGQYTGNTPSYVVVSVAPKYQNIASENTKGSAVVAHDTSVVTETGMQLKPVYLWVVEPEALAQFTSDETKPNSLKKKVVEPLKKGGYLVLLERWECASWKHASDFKIPVQSPDGVWQEDGLLIAHETSPDKPSIVGIDPSKVIGGGRFNLLV